MGAMVVVVVGAVVVVVGDTRRQALEVMGVTSLDEQVVPEEVLAHQVKF